MGYSMTMLTDVLTIVMPAAGAIGTAGYLAGAAGNARPRIARTPATGHVGRALPTGPPDHPAAGPAGRDVPVGHGSRHGASLATLDDVHDPLTARTGP